MSQKLQETTLTLAKPHTRCYFRFYIISVWEKSVITIDGVGFMTLTYMGPHP